MLRIAAVVLFICTAAPLWAASPNSSKPDGDDFSQIFEYTLFDVTLADGKHPVWIYFQSNGNTSRVDIPSMDLCIVTPQSRADLEQNPITLAHNLRL
jgi:hypothetical protein